MLYVGSSRPHYSSRKLIIRYSLSNRFRDNLQPDTVLAALSATVEANVCHTRLGHPKKQVMEMVRRKARVVLTLLTRSGRAIGANLTKPPRKNHPRASRPGNTSDSLKLVSTDVLGPVTPDVIGCHSYMAKYTDHHTRLKAVYFIEKKGVTLHTLCKFIQDLTIPLGLRVQHPRSDYGGEYVSSSFRDYCKTTGVEQQYTAAYTPQQNGISEGTGLL